LGLTAGPVPARVDAGIKEGLLALVDHAVGQGWSARRACALLDVNDRRVSHWQQRRQAGLPLDDAPPGPAEALRGLLTWERQAILELFVAWAEIDRCHRKLAHRGSRLGKVFVSESSVLRVLQAENLVLPAPPARGREQQYAEAENTCRAERELHGPPGSAPVLLALHRGIAFRSAPTT
jgi:putative transposase